MNKRLQRDLFLVLTIIGTLISLAVVAFGAWSFMDSGKDIAANFMNGDARTLAERAISYAPISLAASVILIGTLYSYRRYQEMIATEEREFGRHGSDSENPE